MKQEPQRRKKSKLRAFLWSHEEAQGLLRELHRFFLLNCLAKYRSNISFCGIVRQNLDQLFPFFVKYLLFLEMFGKTLSTILFQAAPGEELKGNISKPTYTGGLEEDGGNLEDDSDFSLDNFGALSPAKEEDFLVKEKKAAIPKKTLSQREPESVNMEINAFLDNSVDDLLKGLSDEEEKHEEALYDLDDDWQHWDDNSPTDDSENIPTADTSPQQNQCTDNVDVIDENIAVSENLDDIVVSRSDDKLSIGSLNNAPTSEAMLREVMSNQMTIEYNLDETTDEEMLTEISAKMTKELLDLFGTEMEEEEENTNNTRPEINLEEKAAAAIKRKRLLPTWMLLDDSIKKVRKHTSAFYSATEN